MMQLLCNGVVLDLYDNAGLQFTHKNPLFAFDSVSCERTTQFKLPATPTNDRVLSVARVPAYSGAGMRQKFAAELQAGTVVQSGYLYVSNFDGTDYNAVFVTGELLGLQNIKNLGKISEYMSYTDSVRIGDNSQQPYTARQNGDRWQNVNYARPSTALQRPSICLAKLYSDIVTAKGITAAALPTEAEQLWLISKGNGINRPCQFKNEVTDYSQPVSVDDPNPADTVNTITEDTVVFDYEDTIYEVQKLSADGQNTHKFNVRQFRAKTDVEIECPDNWPATRYVIDLSFTHEDPDNNTPFYGGRYFESDSWEDPTTHIIPIGEQLKGRSFLVQAGECFSIVDSDFFVNFKAANRYNYGFMLDEEDGGTHKFDFDLTLKVKSASNTLKNGDLCLLQDNLPDVTFTDLLKMFAAVSGRVLNYDEANGVTFDTLDFASWGTPVDLTAILTKEAEVQRTFADYAQQSKIEYKSDDTVRDRIQAVYEIANVNITAEKTLLSIPFSEGDYWLEIPVWAYVDTDVKSEVLGSDMSGSAALWRVALPKNSGLQTLCDESTQIKIECHMPLMQYHAIGAKTLLMVRNKKYVWTERSWQKNIAKFTLAQLP